MKSLWHYNLYCTINSRVKSLKAECAKVIDVDGSYLYGKALQINAKVDDQIPDIPLVGWESIDSASNENCNKIPMVTHGKFVNWK